MSTANATARPWTLIEHSSSNELKQELRSCPFCGHDGRIHKSDAGMFVYCDGPGCLVSVGENYDADAMPDHLFYEEEVSHEHRTVCSITGRIERV